MLRALSTLRRGVMDVGTVPAMPRLWIGGDYQASNARYPGRDQKRVALRTDIGEHRHQQPDLGPDGAGRLAGCCEGIFTTCSLAPASPGEGRNASLTVQAIGAHVPARRYTACRAGGPRHF